MSWAHALPKSRIAFVSAALRHVRDAHALCVSSPVQAYYLAGYGPECARKAALTYPVPKVALELDRAVGHGFGGDGEMALEWLCQLDPLAGRYEVKDWSNRFPALVYWDVRVRYEVNDRYGKAEAQSMVVAAEEAVAMVLSALWADGRVPSMDSLLRVKP